MSREVEHKMRFVVYDTETLHNFVVARANGTAQLDAFLEQHEQYIEDCRAAGEVADTDSIALNDIDWVCERGLAFDQDESQGFAWCESRTEFL